MQGIAHDDNGDDELHKQFKSLEQDWDSYKRSKSRTPRRRRSLTRYHSNDEKSTTVEILQLFDYTSPRRLISSLQQQKQSPFLEEEEEWKVRTNDLAVLEILSERRAAIESGKLKGRRLLEALESAASSSQNKGNHNNNKEDQQNNNNNNNNCSGCSSSVLIQGSEVRSLCSSSYDGDDDECFRGYCSSCSCSVEKMGTDEVMGGDQVEEVKRDEVDDGVGGWSDGGKWMGVMGCVAIFLMAFTLGIITWKSFDGCGDEFEEFLFSFPT